MPTTAADILVRTIMTSNTGLVEDAVVNDFAVRLLAGGTPTGAQLDDAMGNCGDFFRLGATANDRVGTYISNAVDRAVTHEIQAISIASGGSPLRTMAWLGPVTAAAVDPYPSEVAGVLSFHGDLTGISEETGATRPRARRRGRIYVGPLNKSAGNNDPNPLLSDLFTGALRSNATTLYDGLEADGWRWCVWSRTANELYPIVAGWTDNAFDTQRRRGIGPASRTVFTTV